MPDPEGALRPVREALESFALVDHHCHGIATEDLGRERFEALISEGAPPAPGRSAFGSAVGTAVRRHCAPLLDLAPHASAEEYLDRRSSLGWREVSRRFVSASNTGTFLVDTGFATTGLTTPEELAGTAHSATPAAHHEIVRLEVLAERVAAVGADPSDYAGLVSAAIAHAGARPEVVGFKSVAAYRTGFDLEPTRPTEAEVRAAAAGWLEQGQRAGEGFTWRVEHPVLIRHLLWSAADIGLPLQLHTGFGDNDIRMHRVDPSLLTDWFHLVRGALPVVLLHCWPYHRQAGYLASAFHQVYFDVGLTLHYVGPARARAVLQEALEVTPYHKLLYSSDAYGVPEFYHLGAHAFRRGLGEMLDDLVEADDMSRADAIGLAHDISVQNARSLYRLDGADRTEGVA